MTKKNPKVHALFVRLSELQHQRLMQEAARLGVTRQTVARVALGLALSDGRLDILPNGLQEKPAT